MSSNAGAAVSASSSKSSLQHAAVEFCRGDGRRRRRLFLQYSSNGKVNKRSSFSETAAATSAAAGLPHPSGWLSEEEEEDEDGDIDGGSSSSRSSSVRIDMEDEEEHHQLYEAGAHGATNYYDVNAAANQNHHLYHSRRRSQLMRTIAAATTATTPNNNSRNNTRRPYLHVTGDTRRTSTPPSIMSWKWGFTSRRAVKLVGGALDLLSIYRKLKAAAAASSSSSAYRVDPRIAITSTTMERDSGKHVATAKYKRGAGRANPAEDIRRRWTSGTVAFASGRGHRTSTDNMDANMMNTTISTHRADTFDRLRAGGGGCCSNVDVINQSQSVNAKRMVAEEALRETKLGDAKAMMIQGRPTTQMKKMKKKTTKKKNRWRDLEVEEDSGGTKLQLANDKERRLKKRLKEITEEKTEMQKRLTLLTEKKDALILEVHQCKEAIRSLQQRRGGNSRYSDKSAEAEDVDVQQVEYGQATTAASIDRKEGMERNNVVFVVRQSDPYDNDNEQGSRRDDNESTSIITQTVNEEDVSSKDGKKKMVRSIAYAEEVEIEKMYPKQMRKALKKARAECRDQEMIIESLRVALDLQLQLQPEEEEAAATTTSTAGLGTNNVNAGNVIQLMKREVVRLSGMEQALRREAESEREAAMVAQELNVRLVERLKSLYFHVQRWTSSTLLEEDEEEEEGGEMDDDATTTMTMTTAAAAEAGKDKELPDLICSLDDQHFRRFLHQCYCPHTRQLKKLRTHTSHLIHHRTKLLQEVADLRVTLSQATQRAEQLEQQLTLKGKELEIVHQDLQRTREQRDAIKNNADFMTQEAIRLVTEVGKLSRRVEELETNVMLKDGRISILYGALQDFSKTPTITQKILGIQII